MQFFLKILLIYFLLSILLTYPLCFLFEEHRFVGPLEDNLQSMWNPWHVKKAFLETEETLYTTKYLFYPQHYSLRMHSLSLTNAFFICFLNFFLPLSVAYNLTIFISFVLAGFFCFLLCYELTKHSGASFLGGLVFAFSPYHVARALHHINLASIYWFPLLLFFCFQSIRNPHPRHYFILTGIYLLIAFTDYYYFIFAICFGALFFLVYFRQAKYLLVSLIFTFLFFFPVVLQTFIDLKKYQFPVPLKYDEGILDFFSFFIPPPWHSLWGSISMQHFYETLPANPWEMVGYLGYVPLLFAIYGAYSYFRRKEVLFFGILFLLGLNLSLGSVVHFWGKAYFPGLFLILQKIPILEFVRIPSRWMGITQLFLAILAAYGVQKWSLSWEKKKKIQIYFLSTITVLILIEYTCVPFPTSKIEISPFYQQLREEKEEYAILNLPFEDYLYTNYYMYLQTIHEKPMLYGQTSRIAPIAYQFMNTNKVKKISDELAIEAWQIKNLKAEKVRYILLHKRFLKEKLVDEKISNILKKEYEDRWILVFRID